MNLNLQPRQPKGVPIGGEFTTTSRDETGPTLLPTGFSPKEAAERHEALLDAGYAPAVTSPGMNPATTDGIDQWWGDHFVTAEYRASGEGFAQMPDDFTPGMGSGHALSGHRRTSRMKYRGEDVTLRMPSATAIKRFAAQSDNTTFDVPVSGEYPGADGNPQLVAGWVRVTKSPGGAWNALGMGFPTGGDEAVAEGVAAILEARRPSFALRDAGTLITSHRARLAGQGVPMRHVSSAWISAVGYDEASGVMATRTLTGAVYGHLVTKARYGAVAEAKSPGSMFNKLVRGSGRVQVTNCPGCGRFFSSAAPHSCPAPATPQSGVVRNALAQQAATATLGAKARSTAAPSPALADQPQRQWGEHVHANNEKTINVKAILRAQLAQRTSRSGLYGPPGWTVNGVGDQVGPYTSQTYVPGAYWSGRYGDGEPFEQVNGDTGLVRFAGLGSGEARAIRSVVSRKQLAERQNAGPSLGSVLAAAARNPGVVEVHGYVVGPDRDDERFTAEGVHIYDDGISNEKQVIAAARSRFGLDFEDDPDEVTLEETAWRPGEKTWRLWWD